MHLTKLEIFGFKSFANKTVIHFNRDITGIVGPNGCGKTNIVDAIRWALGEQKSSTLRSDKMENVIFNGTNSRKAMGMSEVSLTLENDRGVLPTEYNEVTITRRIFRSGESEYLLNRNVCRLKDITNLFMDTGMGTNAYSVIELKMIETILSNKADERRKMFEEAAGVNKYKLRRRLSLKKLENVKADLTRVNDIVSEVEKTVRSLERQAKKADKYNKIQTVLREKEIDLCEREFSIYTTDKKELQSKEDELRKSRIRVDAEIRELETKLISLREEVGENEIELRNRRREISRLNEKIFSIQKNISVSEERNKSFLENIAEYEREIEEFELQIIETDDLIEEKKNLTFRLKDEISERENYLTADSDKTGEMKSVLLSKKAELKRINDNALELYKKINSLENQIKSKKDNLIAINKEIENANGNILDITNKLAKTVGYLEELEREKNTAKRKLEESERLFSEKQKEKENLQKYLDELKDKELDSKALINGLRDKIDFIRSLITNLEGISKGSKILLEDKSWSEKQHTIFADVGNSKGEYRYALETALQTALNNLLIEDLEELKNAVNHLKNNDLGKASFIILNSERKKNSLSDKFVNFTVKRRKKKIQKETGFLSWAENAIETEEKWRRYFTNVLYRTAVVDTLDNALSLFEKYPSFQFATLDGDLVQPGGIISAGSLPKLDDSIFGRKKYLDDLKNELPKMEDEHEKIKSDIAETENKIAGINLKFISEQGKIIFNDLTNIEKQISQFEFEQRKASEEIDKSRDKIQRLVGQSNSLDTEISVLEKDLNDFTEEKNSTADTLKIIEDEVRKLESEYNESVENHNQFNIELERKRGELKNAEAEIARSYSAIDSLRNLIKKKKSDIENTKNQIESIQSGLEDGRLELDGLNYDKEKLAAAADEFENKLNILKDNASQFENELTGMRNERQRISDTLHEIDMKISDLNHKISRLIEHIKEDYSITLEFKTFDDNDDFDFDAVGKEVAESKLKIKNLGPINLLAYSEFEEENERLQFLLKQRNDLIESEKDLIDTIKEINESAESIFLETFQKIRENFRDIFRTLFDPGDEADLIMEEGVDPLEAKVEIIAKPKGKRPTGIEMLSGGEKTLTATALLFAIYLVKPSPFCIMDEVDAPLDDANVDRFTKLLDEFKRNTQFILVTHNKRTMSAAQNMYGVTMQEEGISKLVGVRFDEIPTE